MSGPLSPTMIEHMRALSDDGERSAYPNLNLATLYALERRGYVVRRETRGAMFFPANTIMWRLTDKGRELLEAEIAK